MIDLFSTTEDGQSGNPIDFDNDFIKLESHLALQTKLIFRKDSIFELITVAYFQLFTVIFMLVVKIARCKVTNFGIK